MSSKVIVAASAARLVASTKDDFGAMMYPKGSDKVGWFHSHCCTEGRRLTSRAGNSQKRKVNGLINQRKRAP